MPASFVWQPGPTGGTPTNAANLNRLAVTADIGSAGTPTGDAIAATVAAIGGGKLVPTATKTAAYAAAVGDLAVMNVAGGATTLTLPTAPANKAQVGYLAIGATTTVPLTVNRGGTDTLGPSGATSVTAVLANEVTVYQYDAPNTRWLPVANVKPQTALDSRYARLPGPLGGWKAKIATDPGNAKVVILGDSTSDAATASCFIHRRLLALHAQQGEGLHGIGASDYYTDGVGNGTPTFTSATANFTAGDVGRLIHGKGFPAGTVITTVNSATSVSVINNIPTGTALPFWVGRHVISGGNNGEPLSHWMANPSLSSLPYNRNQLVADAPHLTIASWLINDIRQGALGLTVDTAVAAGTTLLQSFIDWHRATLPNTDLLLRMPNPLLSANTGSLNYVTDGTNINPAGLAQIYSTALRRIYLSFVGKYPNVDVLDVQSEVFGTRATATHPLMANQLHPSPQATSDINSLTPSGGGYVAIADALAKRIGNGRNAFPPDVAQRVRSEFIVYDGPAAGTVRLMSRDPNMPAPQAPVFRTDSLYVNGLDGPIALTSANVDRTFSSTILTLSGLGTTDFSPYIGQSAEVTSSHPAATTGDRQQIYVDLPSIAANSSASVNVNVTGLFPGSAGWGTAVIVSPGSGFATSGLLLSAAYPDATDRVKMVIQNPTGSAIDLAGESWTFWVVR